MESLKVKDLAADDRDMPAIPSIEELRAMTEDEVRDLAERLAAAAERG